MGDENKGGSGGDTTAVSNINDLTSAIREAMKGKSDGGGEAINEVLMSDNYKYRERHREDQRTIEQLREKLPGEGAIVIPASKAKDLGIESPDDVEGMATDLAELKEKTSTQERQTTFQEAASELGWDPAVLERLPGMEEGRIELRTERVKEDGETTTVKVPYIVPGGEDAAAERLEDYAKNQEAWEPFMPALQKPSDDGDDTGTERKGSTDGTPFPRQPAKGTKAKGGDTVDQFIERQNERAAAPNPLRPKARAKNE